MDAHSALTLGTSCRTCFSAETHLAIYGGRVGSALLGSAVVQALGLQLAAGEAGEVHLQTAEHNHVRLRRRSLPLPQLWFYVSCCVPLKQAGQGRLPTASPVVIAVPCKLHFVQQASPASLQHQKG